MRKYADLSDDGIYRYVLGREWDSEGAVLGFVMLNPSTADAEADDPTIRRCVGFAKRIGYGGIRVVNIYAYRTSSPLVLMKAGTDGTDIVGPENDLAISDAAHYCHRMVAGWGGSSPMSTSRLQRIRQLVTFQFMNI